MFIHVLISVSVEFTVLWHDLDLTHQNYLERNASIDLHIQYVNLILYEQLSHLKTWMTLSETLSHLDRKSQSHREMCLLIQNGMRMPHLLKSPCGQIMIGNEQLLPQHYGWDIQVWQDHLVNVTVFELNIPFDGFHCISNFLLLTEHSGGSIRQIARSCGKIQQKIFYSRSNSVKVVLEVNYVRENISRILHYQYEAMAQEVLSYVKIQPKEKVTKNLELQLLHFVGHVHGFVFFYNTNITMQVLVIQQSLVERADCEAMIYDGPSSKSQLLAGTIDNQGRLEYKSSLFCIAVYFKDFTASNTKEDCINVSTIQHRNMKTNRYLLNTSQDMNLTLMLEAATKNIGHNLVFKVRKRYVKIQLEAFDYIGSTEAGCYFGGIVFISHNTDRASGPFCGEFGMSLLSYKGLTFGSCIVTMAVYLFAHGSPRMFLRIRVHNEQCAGFINPCDLKPGFYKALRYRIIDFKSNVLGLGFGEIAGSCIHIQYIHVLDAKHNEMCGTYYMGRRKAIVDYREAIVNMHYDRYQVQKCPNCFNNVRLKTYRLQLHISLFGGVLNGLKPFNYHEISVTKNDTYRSSARYFVFLAYSLPSKQGVAMDGAFHVALSINSTYKSCSIFDNTLNLNYGILTPIEGTCSVISYTRYAAMNVLFYVLHPGTQITFNIEFQNPQTCSHGNFENSLTLVVGKAESDESFRLFQWFLYEKYLKWTVISTSAYSQAVTLVTDLNDVKNPLKTDIKANIDCPDPLRAQIRHDTSVLEQSTLSYDSTATRYGMFDHCYTLHTVSSTSISWTAASDICKKEQKQLLTINSDLETTIISEMINKNQLLLFSQVVFLNLKNNDKVVYTCSTRNVPFLHMLITYNIIATRIGKIYQSLDIIAIVLFCQECFLHF